MEQLLHDNDDDDYKSLLKKSDSTEVSLQAKS